MTSAAREGVAVERVYLLSPLPFNGRIRDAVHGDIEYVRGAEDALLDSWPVQRLRYIYQLQLAHLVYPSATHTSSICSRTRTCDYGSRTNFSTCSAGRAPLGR